MFVLVRIPNPRSTDLVEAQYAERLRVGASFKGVDHWERARWPDGKLLTFDSLIEAIDYRNSRGLRYWIPYQESEATV
jgi:hypothetical protein